VSANSAVKKNEETPKTMNRWIVVVGGILIQLALGAIYAWSAFTTPLQGATGSLSEFAFSKTETQAIFSAGLLTFAIFTIIVAAAEAAVALAIVLSMYRLLKSVNLDRADTLKG
jgi:hypothetical protein